MADWRLCEEWTKELDAIVIDASNIPTAQTTKNKHGTFLRELVLIVMSFSFKRAASKSRVCRNTCPALF